MELQEALAQAQTKLAGLRQRRKSVAADLAQIDGEVEETSAEEAVLSRLVARYEGVPMPTQAQDDGTEAIDWRGLPRMVAVERVLLEANEPLSPTNVNRALLAHGRDDPSSTVHAALSHLKVKDRATQVERGFWIHPSKSNGQSAEVTPTTL